MKTIPQKAAAIAKILARNDSHGYDNREGHRMGDPDYACSSFVAACYRFVGVNVPANSYTQTMRKQWREYGFRDVASKVNLRTGANVKKGDVLIAPGKHTAICINSFTHRLAEACGNPRGGAANGEPGDQTGREIKLRPWYDDGWTQCLRYKS